MYRAFAVWRFRGLVTPSVRLDLALALGNGQDSMLWFQPRARWLSDSHTDMQAGALESGRRPDAAT